MNKTVMIIVAIVVLLCMCCVVGGVGAYLIFPSMIGDQFSSITSALGTSGPEALSTVVPTVSSSGKVTFPSSSAASSAVSSGASSKASSGVSSAPGAGGIGGLLGDALGKAKTAAKYRMQFTMLLGGTANGKYTEEELASMSADVDGKNIHTSMKLPQGSGTTAFESIVADGKTYMKIGNDWYITNAPSTTGAMSDFSKPDSFQDYVDDPTSFKKVGSESLDGQQCDVWSGVPQGFDTTSMLGIFAMGRDSGDIGVVDKSEFRIWLCKDGYVHQFMLNVEGHNSKTPTEKGAFKMNGHMWDFNNSAISVTAPANAKPMPGSK